VAYQNAIAVFKFAVALCYPARMQPSVRQIDSSTSLLVGIQSAATMAYLHVTSRLSNHNQLTPTWPRHSCMFDLSWTIAMTWRRRASHALAP
jgi:hypothetical protein